MLISFFKMMMMIFSLLKKEENIFLKNLDM